MKKYHQLLIVGLGLVSFICFLIYKHEYDRLRLLVETLEVWGSPPVQPLAVAPMVDRQQLAPAPVGAEISNNQPLTNALLSSNDKS